MNRSITSLLYLILLLASLALVGCTRQTGATPAPGTTTVPTPVAAPRVPTPGTTTVPTLVAAPRVPTALPAATAPTDVPPTPAASDTTASITAAIQERRPRAFVTIRCVQGDFAAAAVAPFDGKHGFDAYLREQNGTWTILTDGVDIRRESLLALGFPQDFCGMPPAGDSTPPTVPPASSPLVGAEWTMLVTGDLDRNGREDVVAFKPAPIRPQEPAPGSQPKDVFVAFSELVVVERAEDGAPTVRLFMDNHTVLADNQEIAQMPGASRPTSGVLAELRYPDRSFELRLIDDTGALGKPFLTVRYHEDAGAYRAEAATTAQVPLNIGALTISPSEPAPAGPESSPSGRQAQAGATVTLSVPVQGARQVIFFAEGRGQSGNPIGSNTELSADHAESVWTVPEGVSQLALYARALDGVGGVITSTQLLVNIKAGGTEYDLPERLLRAYYKAINAKDYQRAYGYWENPPTTSFDEFVQGYGDTASVAVLLGPDILEGAAGSQYAHIPTVLAVTSTQGGLKMFSGCYVARQTNADVDPSRGGKWFLNGATITEAPPNVSTKQLLAQGCQQ